MLAVSLVAAVVVVWAIRDAVADARLAHADSLRLAALPERLSDLPEPRPPDTTKAVASPPAGSRLSPLADSLSHLLVFELPSQQWYTGASRAKRLLLDLGRVDADVAKPPAREAYLQAVRARSPVRVGDHFLLRGTWGAGDATVSGYDTWSGRIVATLAAPKVADSLAREKAPLVVSAFRVDTTAPPDSTAVAADSAARRDSAAHAAPCVRDSVPAGVQLAAQTVRDSIFQVLKADSAKQPERIQKSIRARATSVIGCFGGPRLLLFVTVQGGDYTWVQERAVLIDDNGAITSLRVSDRRWKGHEALSAFDADGDGVDDVATRGRAVISGGTSILRLNAPKKRLEFLTGGFAWESF